MHRTPDRNDGLKVAVGSSCPLGGLGLSSLLFSILKVWGSSRSQSLIMNLLASFHLDSRRGRNLENVYYHQERRQLQRDDYVNGLQNSSPA